MSELLGQIGGWFGSPAGKGLGEIAGLGATGAGLIGNLAADRQRAQAAAAAKANMNLSPAALGAMVSGAEQPLNRSLVQDVTGNVNANLAEQGLSEAPGLIATATSQALAPFQQANQQTALQLVLRKLGLPAEFASTIPQNAQLAPLLALLMHSFGSTPGTPGGGTSPTGGASGSYPTMPFPFPTGGPMPSPNLPIDWLGQNPLQANLPPDMAPPDVGGGF
jgi:hypothetical protein